MPPDGREQPDAAQTREAIGLLDELPEDPAAQPQRLAGVGAALGSCFSVMLVVLAIGSAGSLSGPRSGLAGEPQPDDAVLSQPRRIDEKPLMPYSDVVRLQSLERAAMLARVEMEAAESRLARVRSQIQQRALQQAQRAREQAQQVETQGSPYDWMSSEHLATRTLNRAQAQLRDDLAALGHMQELARAELERLRVAAETAEAALARAREEVMPQPAVPASASTSSGPAPDGSPNSLKRTAGVDGDLRPLIDRHHASLIEAAAAATVRD